MNNVDLQPDVLEVLQSEQIEPAGSEPTVSVCLTESRVPVRTQELPHKGGATRTTTVGTTAVHILRADKRRARATLMSIGQNMLIAFNTASKEDPGAMQLWPANVPFPVTHATDVWVASATATTSISYSTEVWATGEQDS